MSDEQDQPVVGTTHEHRLAPGTTLGDCRIVDFIASGSMGRVYLAEQINLGRQVAVKVFSRILTPDPEEREQFLREVRLTAKLDHPNIVRAYDAGQDGDYLFLVMKYVDERDLGELLSKHSRIDESDALFIAGEIAKALRYAWDEHGLIHRDIKPSNIKLNKAIEPHLLDFGISTSNEQKCALAEHGYVIGTPEYVSPEQASGRQDLDFRSDVYSLGATLYHMVTGSRPFQAKEPERLLMQQMAAELEPACERNPKVSRKVSDLITRMMSKKPEGRPESWQAVIDAIEDAGKPSAEQTQDVPVEESSAEAIAPESIKKTEPKHASAKRQEPTEPKVSKAEIPLAADDEVPSKIPWLIAGVLGVVAIVLLIVILIR